jgi:hypothetical protein
MLKNNSESKLKEFPIKKNSSHLLFLEDFLLLNYFLCNTLTNESIFVFKARIMYKTIRVL